MSIVKKNIKSIIGLLLVGIVIWFAYDVHFKYVINEYQGNQIGKQLKKDFVKNSKGFEKIIALQSELINISDLQFSQTDDYIRFEIKSDSLPTDDYDLFQIYAGKETNNTLKYIGISEKDSIIIEYENEIFKVGEPWVISFNGKKSDPELKQILSLKKIDLEYLNTIEKLLRETNSIAFEKNDSIIKLRYAGHWSENYNYITPVKNLSKNENWDKLSKNWYSSHFKNELFCGFTDW